MRADNTSLIFMSGLLCCANWGETGAADSPSMNGHDESATSSSTEYSPSKPLSTPKGLPSLNGKHQDSAAKAKADSRNSTPRQGTQAQSDSIKALEGTVTDLRVRKPSQPAHMYAIGAVSLTCHGMLCACQPHMKGL